jgi:hypothetical protein
LRAFAAKTFELNSLDADGLTLREVLEGLLERTTNETRRAVYLAELACPPLPEALIYLWHAFCRLSARRGSGFSVSPISWSDIDAFVRNAGMKLAPWEIRILEDIDDLYRASLAAKPTQDESPP